MMGAMTYGAGRALVPKPSLPEPRRLRWLLTVPICGSFGCGVATLPVGAGEVGGEEGERTEIVAADGRG
jgi:hypothetical protein